MEIPNREKLEAAFAAKLSRLSSRHRRELESLLGWPPDLDRVPAEFWRKVQQETENEIAAALLLLFQQSHDFHLRLAGGDPMTTRRAMLGAGVEFATRQARDISTAMADKARTRLATIAAKEWQAAELATDQQLRRQRVMVDLVKTFNPAAAVRTAVTQTTAAQSAGGESAIMRSVGLDGEDIWKIHPELSASGTCAICRPYDGRPRRIWEIDFPLGPPAHENCNCEIIYAKAGEMAMANA